jgi:GTP cyclohydrolase I
MSAITSARVAASRRAPRTALVVVRAPGLRTPGAKTVTSAVRGLIQTNEATRAEVFALINAPH